MLSSCMRVHSCAVVAAERVVVQRTSLKACTAVCNRAKEVYEFAYTYPYSYSQLQRWLLGWQRQHLPYLHRHLLCRTPHMKKVDVLVIQDTSIDVGQSLLGMWHHIMGWGGGAGLSHLNGI